MFRYLLSRCIKFGSNHCHMLSKSNNFTRPIKLFQKRDVYRLQSFVYVHGGVLRRNETNSFFNDKSSHDQDRLDDTEDGDIKEKTRKEISELLAIGWQAPEKISDPDIEHFLTLTSKKGRKKFLRFLFKKEMLKKKDKMKREEKARQRALVKETQDSDEDSDVFPNRFFLRIQNNTIMQFEKWRLAAGMKFGPKIAFDFSYENLMRKQEVISLVQQLMHVMNANKRAKDPFDIHWVGLTSETQSLHELNRLHGVAMEHIMVNHTEKDLLEVFPKKDIIYLSADSPNVMKSYDSDKVYVIGALVDRNIIYTGQSLARAKRFGLEHARLPLDRHLQWTTGAKNLTLDQMIKIMIEMNTSGDWVKALQHVPVRKHAGLRSGPHWDQDQESKHQEKFKSNDSIQRNPSHFVASRTKQIKGSSKRSGVGKRQKNLEVDDDTDSTLFSSSSGAKGWFSGDH
ncbi:tRNA methyltransferase 10 homolog C-like [Lytechinus variegatus]|uniref:tRNA methyltransferase 10 homolog C-like n=1 Tax=Lytechinus variegatus TaxID=7654 RepID=UPI001BB0F9FF|nr:tRNA methyltransferase 10 homolog C-like [Lytechinus variegatus]